MVHYRVYKNPSLVRILSQMHPVHNFPPNYHKIHSIITLTPTPMSSKWYRPFMFTDQKCLYFFHLFHACYMSRTSIFHYNMDK